jgi:hypothetical protein
VPNGVTLKLALNIWAQLANTIADIAENFGLPPPIKGAIALAGLYKGANLKLNFRAPEVLPKGIRDRFLPSEHNEITMIREKANSEVPELERRFADALSDHGTGALEVYFKASKVAVSVRADLPGLSGIWRA